MKRGNLKQRVLDALYNTPASSKSGNSPSAGSSNATNSKSETDIAENLTSECFQLCKIVRHGFPHRPTALAYDPMQRLIAVGNRTGSIRLLGQPGVDVHVTHDVETAVVQLLFLINEGGLISVCADNSLNMWNLRQKKPGILHTLKFNRERITHCHLPYQSKWLYIGTDRGNVHLCCVETFMLSGYVINWNKAIELSQKTHPGHIVGISENPCDENRLLIAFETGLIVLWDLKMKLIEYRYYSDSPVQSITWHHEGKQFMCCHANGSLSLWNYRNVKPQQVQYPHAKSSDSSKFDNYWPIEKLEWKSCRSSDPFVIFTGGLPQDMDNVRPSVTVMRGKSMTVLEMDYNVVDFIVISKTPWRCDFQDPVALAVLLDKELVVVDLVSPGYPSIEFPHPVDIHDSPVTCLHYVLDKSSDLTPGLYQVAASKPKRSSTSKMEWPMDGGEWSVDSCTGSPEIMVTGHADGSVRFWDASAASLRELYKLRTYKYFKRSSKRNHEVTGTSVSEPPDPHDSDNFAISHIQVCPESRCLLISNVGGAVLFCELNRNEITKEITSLELQPVCESYQFDDSPMADTLQSPGINDSKPLLRQGSESLFPQTTAEHRLLSKSLSDDVRVSAIQHQMSTYAPILKLRSGNIKQSPGFQAELICQITGADIEPHSPITELSFSSAYGVFAVGTMNGLYLVDTVQKKVLLTMASCDLSSDRKRQPKSPNRIKPPTSLGDIVQMCVSEAPLKSPSVDVTDGNALSGNRTPHKESTSSMTSSGSGPPPRPKKPPSRFTNKKSSFSFEKSLDSQTSMATDDSPFSRTSSINELDRPESRDMVTSLIFVDSYPRKDDSTVFPSLWVGTAGGCVCAMELNQPEHRIDVPLMALPTGTIIQMKGSVVNCSFLNSMGVVIPSASKNWKDIKKLEKQNSTEGTSNSKRSPDVSRRPHHHQSQSSLNGDKHFMIVTSEKQVKVIALPAQSLLHVYNVPNEAGCILSSEVAVVQAGTCLLCHTSMGYILVLSLPSLSVLLSIDYLNPNDVRISQTLCFTPDAQAIYMPTPSEVQRLTCSVELYESMQEIVGYLFIPCDAPERPNPGFFKSLFGGGVSELDREELFGEAKSGKASRGVAKHIPGSGSMSLEGLRGQAQHGLTEMQKLRLAALERGEKLGELDEKTQRMQESAQKFSDNAHSLMMKYKNKKWYQL
uniref:syntaxin-binding protein 5-like n=1 Tax=Styela clava TaxID=7725 RepID=UPI00193A155A|nr:syntaxin-binding protein 5-like [Styela clava]